MFKVGDIVRPKIGFIGHNYCFQIIEVEMNPFEDDLYKLQRIEQEIDLRYGSEQYQIYRIKQAEHLWWKKNEIEFATNVKLRYDTTTESILNEITTTTIKLDANKITLTKGKNKMDILDVYKERKRKALDKELLDAKENVKKEDEIQKIIIEMTNQVNTILENEGSDTRYESHPNLYTLKTEAKLDELEKEHDEHIKELRSTLEEIRALFELTDDYNERIKILKNYDILDKKGKLNV